MTTDDFLQDLWRAQSLWSLTANRMKRKIERARTAALLAGMASAVFGTLGATIRDQEPEIARVLAAAAAFFILILPILRQHWTGPALRDWTRARSVSEAIKSEVHLWLARAGDYADDHQAAKLLDRTTSVCTDAADLVRFQSAIMPAERALPEVNDPVSYFAVRVTGQIDGYYRPKAQNLQSRLGRFRMAENAIVVAGVVLGVAAAATAEAPVTSWIAVVTTLGSAIAVHVAATRYEYQLIEFLRTAARLDQLRVKAARSKDTDELRRLAVAAEDVISVENQGWMAKLAEDPPKE